jgi:putative ABC transport system ATP-binding protein
MAAEPDIASRSRAVIKFHDVNKVYPMADEEVRALDGVNVTILEGEYVAVVGPSGSGKSTMMNLIGCLDTPTSGTYELSGVDVSKMTENELADVRNQRIGFVFQTFNLLPRLSTYANVELPLIYRGLASQERKELVTKRLEQVGLWERRSHRPSELSGGQRQRVAIARALVTEPAILLADEPTGNLDQTTGREILALFAELHGAGQTIVLVTHDQSIAERAERIIEIRDGRITADRRRPGVLAAVGSAS